MMRSPFSAVLLSLVFALTQPGLITACPSCRDAVPSTTDAEEDDQTREARAYNSSIYLMAGMPYLLLGMVGVGLYRHARKRK